jgi:hypothetical protein
VDKKSLGEEKSVLTIHQIQTKVSLELSKPAAAATATLKHVNALQFSSSSQHDVLQNSTFDKGTTPESPSIERKSPRRKRDKILDRVRPLRGFALTFQSTTSLLA